MLIDTFLTIGKTHKICEDYIISGTTPFPFIVLSDGCSSSKETDMGSRILCYLAKQYIQMTNSFNFNPDHYKMGLWVINNAETLYKHLGLNKTALDATLIIAYALSNKVRVHIYGDGCITLLNSSKFLFTEIEYSQNAPYYLSYNIDSKREEVFHKMKQIKNIIRVYKPKNEDWIKTEISVSYNTPSYYDFILEPDDCLLISSDGITSFIKDKQGLVSVTDYIEDFLAFKTIKGEFLNRRASRVLKDLASNNIFNADDLSIGAFFMEE